ncbi:hypothetical protein KSS87_018980 [Heliosperma pusillum]|nr:hypothetical protein KSS87_018980 [Heliosperma pusillum]
MNQGILQWSPCFFSNSFTSFQSPTPYFTIKLRPFSSISATLNSLEQNQQQQQEEEALIANLPAKERRKLKNERRQSKAVNWKEEVEMKLIKKPKKRYATWTEELNLDNLAQLGPQWWAIRVSRVTAHFTADRLALALSNNYPHMDFKMYTPTVKEKIILKKGPISVKPRPLYPGCIFLRCVLNRDIHAFVRDVDGIGGFIGSLVGNTIRQIIKPRPVDEEDMEKIFQEAKREQEKADLAFQEKHKQFLESLMPNLDTLNGVLETPLGTSTKIPIKKVLESSGRGRKSKYPKIGSSVRVVSGSFAEFSGIVKKVDRKNERVTVGFTIFGKETISDLNLQEIASEE